MKPSLAVFDGGDVCKCVCGCGEVYRSRVAIVLRRYSETDCPRCLSDHPVTVVRPRANAVAFAFNELAQ